MDPSDLEKSSGEEDNMEDNSGSKEKSKSDNEGDDFPTSVEKEFEKKIFIGKKDDQDQKKPNEAEDSGAIAGTSKTPDKSETTKIQGGSPIGSSRKRSAYKISPMIVKIIKHSQSRLSSTSTDANFGSSSSSSTSSEEEQVDDLEEVGELYESADVSDSASTSVENKPKSPSGTHGIPPEMSTSLQAGSAPSTTESSSNYPEEDEMSSKPRGSIGHSLLKISKMMESPPMEIEVLSDSSSATSSNGADVGSESQTANHAITGAGETSSPEMSIDNQADSVPPTPMENSSNDSEMDYTTILTSSESLETERMDTITAPAMPKQASSSHPRESETSRALSDGGATGGIYDYEFDLKNDKSVRRKIKSGTPVVSDANKSPTKRSPTADSKGSRRVGRSLLRISQRMEETSSGGTRTIFDTGYESARSFGSRTWLNELLNLCNLTEDVNRNLQLDTQSLLEEVRQFFQRNPVVADESLNWKETKRRIIASKYFSDEFARDHGMLPYNQLMRKFAEELENFSASYVKSQLKKMQLLSRLLLQYDISEKNLIDYCEDCTLIPHSRMACSSSDQTSSLTDDIRRRILFLAEEVGWDALIDLYRKVSTGRTSFAGMLLDSKSSEAPVTEIRQGESPSLSQWDSGTSATTEAKQTSRHTESPSPSQSHILVLSFKPQDTKQGTSSEDKSGNLGPSSGNERDLSNQGEPMEESESGVSEPYSQVVEDHQPHNESIPLSPSEAMETNDGENVGDVSAQHLESEPDRTIDEQ